MEEAAWSVFAGKRNVSIIPRLELGVDEFRACLLVRMWR